MILPREKARHVQKGYGIITATTIVALYFLLFPKLIYTFIYNLQSFSRIQIYNIVTITCSVMSYIVFNLSMEFIYINKFPFLEKYRILKTPRPWEMDQAAWNIKRKAVLQNYMINTSIASLLGIIDSLSGVTQRQDLESYPSLFEIGWQVLFSILIDDTLFYWIHRLLHLPILYSRIHKKHHEFYTTVSMASAYAHILEYLFGNVLPFLVGPILLGNNMHLITMATWLIIRSGETVDGHSGYEFPWSPYRLLPFSASSECHNFHHSQNVGNFGSWFQFWDIICQTNRQFWMNKNK